MPSGQTSFALIQAESLSSRRRGRAFGQPLLQGLSTPSFAGSRTTAGIFSKPGRPRLRTRSSQIVLMSFRVSLSEPTAWPSRRVCSPPVIAGTDHPLAPIGSLNPSFSDEGTESLFPGATQRHHVVSHHRLRCHDNADLGLEHETFVRAVVVRILSAAESTRRCFLRRVLTVLPSAVFS